MSWTEITAWAFALAIAVPFCLILFGAMNAGFSSDDEDDLS